MSGVQGPTRGPGRPRKPVAPRDAAQARLAEALEAAELERDGAELDYRGANNVTNELALLSAELTMTTAWSAYLRSQGNHAQALKYGDLAAKYARQISALRGLILDDKLDAMDAQSERDSELGRMVAADLEDDDV